MERRERYSLNGGRRSCGSLDGGIPYWSGYKHPLQHTWTLWYLDIVKTRSWSDCLAQIGSFNTIEDFWCLFNHVKPVSLLKHGSDYSLFKDGIRPMWEDSANVNGGRWLINLDKKMSHSKLNEFWLEVAMCMIGECFYGYNDRVCGATINVRNRGHKIGVWLNSSDNEREVIHIGYVVQTT
ncbi:hypothetical protein AAG570_007463 [Ranatra chinensis]|uniref:eIF-4F 25 kDa subunit n=1 Tax=Ranatra chinensis TaxID=642074 RepID=A0ABD0XW92_9HEMI